MTEAAGEAGTETATDSQQAAGEQETQATTSKEVDWKSKAREWESRAKENKAKADAHDQYVESQKSEAQKLADERDQHKSTAAEAKAEAARLRAALKYGLAEEDLDLLGSGSDGDIDARAKRVAERLGGTRTNFDGGARTPADAPTDMNDLIRRSRSTR